MTNSTLTDFALSLASKSPVPGGGGAAALCGALAAALGSMVGNYTVGKKKYAAFEPEIQAAMDECGALRRRFLELIDEDAAAFEPLSRAYSIPKDDPDRDKIMGECLAAAAAAPLEMTALACRAIELSSIFAEKGSTIMVSDAGCAAALAKAALDAAALNVLVNAKSMGKAGLSLAETVQKRRSEYGPLADEIYASVLNKLL